MKKVIFFILILAVAAIAFFILANSFIFKSAIEFSIEDKSQKKEEIYKNPEESILEKLTLDQKIGQLFIIGIKDKGKIMGPELKQLIQEIHPGGILLLSENIGTQKQLEELIQSLQKIAIEDTGLPLFIAVDQEGGIVSKISWADKTPQSEIKDASQAYELGKKRGEELKKSFINLNFSPLLDASKSSDFIFERTFQKTEEEIGEFSRQIIRGQKKSGIFSTIKHFPGYGGISFNPEDKLATVVKAPGINQFKKASEAYPEFIMISNVVYKDFDPKLPFSFLPSGINYLKEHVKGDYLIVSDDLSQYSLLNNFPLDEVVYKPFNAGIDVLIFSGWRKSVPEGINVFKGSVKDGKVSLDRINESLLKIIKLKSTLNK